MSMFTTLRLELLSELIVKWGHVSEEITNYSIQTRNPIKIDKYIIFQFQEKTVVLNLLFEFNLRQ